MDNIQTLKSEMDDAAVRLGISTSTIGKCAGQGGHFYRRISSGARCWPETTEKVRRWIADEYERRNQITDKSHD